MWGVDSVQEVVGEVAEVPKDHGVKAEATVPEQGGRSQSVNL